MNPANVIGNRRRGNSNDNATDNDNISYCPNLKTYIINLDIHVNLGIHTDLLIEE